MINDPIGAKQAAAERHEMARQFMKQKYTIEGKEIIEEVGADNIISAFINHDQTAINLLDKYVMLDD